MLAGGARRSSVGGDGCGGVDVVVVRGPRQLQSRHSSLRRLGGCRAWRRSLPLSEELALRFGLWMSGPCWPLLRCRVAAWPGFDPVDFASGLLRSARLVGLVAPRVERVVVGELRFWCGVRLLPAAPAGLRGIFPRAGIFLLFFIFRGSVPQVRAVHGETRMP